MSIPSLRTDEEITSVYNRYVDTVYRIALMILKCRAEAEDVTSTVFIKLITAEISFASDEHLKAWLIVTAQNTCKDVLKSRWFSKRIDYDSIEEPSYFPKAREIWEEIVALDEKYKMPIYLHYYEGYKTEEIAKMLKVNHATVRTRLRTAKKKLKLLLGFGEEEAPHEPKRYC
ncbi:MAG: sigma-70 family RNA polymerase sigma factor [Defluviitaleaceae bacterium]|nr:sigma-70 family RNA polymerase sigma factor [Defluviitaleaceae bacterium]